LPEESSDEDSLQEEQVNEETDDELEDYYDELGITDEVDFNRGKDKKKGKTQAPVSQKKQEQMAKKSQEKRDKQDIISGIISKVRSNPNHKNLARIVKMVRQIFVKDTSEDDEGKQQ